MILLALFVIGASVGSFLNVCIWRLPRGENVAHPPSHCPGCDRRLGGLDMVPILSQVLLRSRCRYCGVRFSWRYAGIEALTGALFVLVGAQPGNIVEGTWWTGAWGGDGADLLRMLIVVSCLVVVFWIDLETMTIPISAALILGLAGVGADCWHVGHGSAQLCDGSMLWFHILPSPLPGSLLAMTATAGVVAMVREFFSWLYQREAMGFGDVFLVAAVAANIGWSELVVTFFFISVFVALGIGVLQLPKVLRAWRRGRQGDARRRGLGRRALALPLARRTFRKLEMPFGPSLAIGALLTMLYGKPMTKAYLAFGDPEPAAGIGQVAPVVDFSGSRPPAPPYLAPSSTK